jgi:hypothetical protein
LKGGHNLRKLFKLRRDQKAWVYAKLSVAAWAVILMLFTPTPVANALGVVITGLISLSVCIGVATSVAGMLHAQSPYTVAIKKGTKVELAGLWLAFSGPAAYMMVQIFLVLFGEDPYQRMAVVFAYQSMAAFILVRIVIVQGFRKKMLR